MSPNRRGWGPETAPTPPGSPERLPRRVSSKGNGPHDLTATAGVPPTPSPQGGVPERPGVTGIERWHRNQRFCETEDGTSEEGLIGRPGGPSGTPRLLSNLSDKGMSYVWTTLWSCNRRSVPLVPPVRSRTEIPSKPPCDGRNRRPALGSAGRNGEETARRHRPRGRAENPQEKFELEGCAVLRRWCPGKDVPGG